MIHEVIYLCYVDIKLSFWTLLSPTLKIIKRNKKSEHQERALMFMS